MMTHAFAQSIQHFAARCIEKHNRFLENYVSAGESVLDVADILLTTFLR
jgi:hypothetical protein